MVQEQPMRVERRLAAILAADVAGYSRLMHHDEYATYVKVRVLLADSVTPAISEHGGRIVKNTGDGFLAVFPSAVEAVRAAMQFQTYIKELTAADAEDMRIAFRTGINVGDVIVEPHDVFGDSVNIAARLESIAEPGGICISASAYDHIQGKVDIEFADLGELTLKNIDRLVRAYAVVPDGRSQATQVDHARLGRLSPPNLSIVVLPFANLSGDPVQDYFVDGVTETLTTDLSSINGSFVIGRHTAFTYKGKSVDLKQVGRELNVRYVIEGSVQRGGNRLRVNVQLVDAETGNHLWAERFDKPVADLFDMQDEIVARLANTLNAQLIEAEARRADSSPHPNSLDLYFQGAACFNRGLNPVHMEHARAIFERALALDPKNIEAMVWMATVDMVVGSTWMSDDRASRLAAAEATLKKVLSLAPNHAWAHVVLGHVRVSTNRADLGVAGSRRALALDRNLAGAHALIGLAKYCTGQGAETEAHVNEAFRLSPRDIFAPYWGAIIGASKLQISADDEALDWFCRSIEANRTYPHTHFLAGAALALLGSPDHARAAATAGLTLVPSFTIRRYRDGAYTDNSTYLAKRERIYEGMRLAGVPEG
jgi:TolB-like protein/class 3 adenylate cyclase